MGSAKPLSHIQITHRSFANELAVAAMLSLNGVGVNANRLVNLSAFTR